MKMLKIAVKCIFIHKNNLAALESVCPQDLLKSEFRTPLGCARLPGVSQISAILVFVLFRKSPLVICNAQTTQSSAGVSEETVTTEGTGGDVH